MMLSIWQNINEGLLNVTPVDPGMGNTGINQALSR